MDERTAEGNTLTPDFISHFPVGVVPTSEIAVGHGFRWLTFCEIESADDRYAFIYHVLVQADETVVRKDVVMLDKQKPLKAVIYSVFQDQIFRIGNLIGDGNVTGHPVDIFDVAPVRR